MFTDFPALCYVDWNAMSYRNGKFVHTLVSERSFSRPVSPGEIVLLVCNDGGWMATWGQVGNDGSVTEVAHEGPSPTHIYTNVDGSPALCVIKGCNKEAIRYCSVPWLEHGGFRFCDDHDGDNFTKEDWIGR